MTGIHAHRSRPRAARWPVAVALLLLTALLVGAPPAPSPIVEAQSYQRISGEGSSWSANAIDAMRVNVRQFGITVDYNPSGSTAGRKNYLNGTVDFAASDIPFQFEPEDGSAPERPEPDSYAYIPVTAGGTSFMYNLTINGRRVTNLRLSGENVSKIFTGAITEWNDPAIAADNPGLTMPARKIVPVVRSDGSGSTAQFTQWMIAQHGGLWTDYCQRSGRAPRCGSTSFYPTIPGMIAQAGDLGVAGYVSQGFAEGSIGYVNYSYALGVQFPVVKVLNAAGFYTEPTPENVAVSLLKARINTNAANRATYLTQDLSGVYSDRDPRNYQLSSYSYFILPTKVQGQFNEAKGRTLSAFAYYAMCQAQQQSASLGYSPIPINLVEASFEQIRLIPGAEVQSINIQECRNPTFSADGTNVLARDAPQPQACDRQGQSQCPNGTGGLRNVPTETRNPEQGGGGSTGGGSTGGGSSGGATSGGGTSGGSSGGGTSGGGTSGGGTSGDGTSGGGNVSGGGTTTGGATAGGDAGTAGGGAGVASDGSAVDPSGGSTNTPTSGDGTVDGSGGGVSPGGTEGSEGSDGLAADDGFGDPTSNGDPSLGGADENCDPDTGICGLTGDQEQSLGSPSTGGAPQAFATPTTLEADPGWGNTETLMIVVVLLTLGLVLAPAYYWRRLKRSEATT